MFLDPLDRTTSEPLTDQIVTAIRARIASGALALGDRLPPTRELARALFVGRNTVVSAYRRLVEEGWLESGVGRGTFVARGPDAATHTPSAPATFDWEARLARSARMPTGVRAARGDDTTDAINFAGAVPDPELFPVEDIRRTMTRVLKREGARALDYGPAAGFEPLRAFIAARAVRQGMTVEPQDVLIVGGSQQGLDLVARLLLESGDTVVTEHPTYANALAIWQLYGARVAGVPMDGAGMDARALDDTLRSTRAKFVYVMPTFQNPTGLTMPESRRRDILRVASEHGVAIVEDQFDSDLRYAGADVAPLAAHDAGGRVVYLGTFSKMLFPGFRLGWIITPPQLRDRLLDLKRTCDLSTSLSAQMVVHEFCASGGLDRHVERVRRVSAKRLSTMLKTIDRTFPDEATVTRPEGGMTVWVTLPAGVDAVRLETDAARRGVWIAPGPWFHADRSGSGHIRLSFVTESEARIEAGVTTLAELIETQRKNGGGTVASRAAESAPFL